MPVMMSQGGGSRPPSLGQPGHMATSPTQQQLPGSPSRASTGSQHYHSIPPDIIDPGLLHLFKVKYCEII